MSTEEVIIDDEELAPDPAQCEHDWKWIDDWYGDPSIPYGTADCSHWRCTKCDSTDCEDDPPDDGPDPDEARERQAEMRRLAHESQEMSHELQRP